MRPAPGTTCSLPCLSFFQAGFCAFVTILLGYVTFLSRLPLFFPLKETRGLPPECKEYGLLRKPLVADHAVDYRLAPGQGAVFSICPAGIQSSQVLPCSHKES